MRAPPGACRESMERARSLRWQQGILPGGSWYWRMAHRSAIRRERDEIRAIVARLRALRVQEAGILGKGR